MGGESLKMAVDETVRLYFDYNYSFEQAITKVKEVFSWMK